MKLFFDILFLTDCELQIIQADFGTDTTKETYNLLFKNWVHEKRHITSVFPISASET